MTGKTFSEIMKEEQEKFESMSKEEKIEYLEQKYPGLIRGIEEQTINGISFIPQEVAQRMKQFKTQPGPIKTPIDLTREEVIQRLEQLVGPIKIPIDQTTEIKNERINKLKKQARKANIALLIAISSLIIAVLALLISIFK